MSNRDLKRIALLLPNTDTILETDLQISLPSNIIIHTARMQLDEVGKEAEKRMVDEELPRAVSALKHITNFDGAVFGCTSASAVYGEEGLSRISRELEDGLDCPATNAFSAVLSEIRKKFSAKIFFGGAVGPTPALQRTPSIPSGYFKNTALTAPFLPSSVERSAV